VSDSNLTELRSKVIDALQKSNEPQLEDCSMMFYSKNAKKDSAEYSIDTNNHVF
jgi:hypothetical protein